jgi:hypothetical protein
MKRIVISVAAVLLLLGLLVAAVLLRVRAENPAQLIARIQRARGAEREELLLRLSISRGDVLTELIKRYNERTADAAFRAEMVDLIFKRGLRGDDPRLEPLYLDALQDPQPEVRRAAAKGMITYGDQELRAKLIPGVADSDPEVRRCAYAVIVTERSPLKAPMSGIYEIIQPEERASLTTNCLRQLPRETDPDMIFLCKGVIGHEVENRCFEADQARGSGDVEKARRLLESAIALDPAHPDPQVRLARLYLETDQRDKALATARTYGALFEFPRLPSAPVVDGDPSDEAWKTALVIDKFYHTTSRWTPKQTEGKSRALLGHHGGRIYIAILGFEKDLDKLVATRKNRDDDEWYDDCAEILFDFGCDGKSFVQFVVNSLGGMFDVKDNDKSKNFDCEFKAGVFKPRGYWAMEFSIDARELSGKPLTPDTLWAFNIFRTRIGAASEHCAMWPPFGETQRPYTYPFAMFADAGR